MKWAGTVLLWCKITFGAILLKIDFFLHKMAGWFDGDVKCYICICYLRLSHQNSNFKSKTNKRFFFALNPKIRLELYIH